MHFATELKLDWQMHGCRTECEYVVNVEVKSNGSCKGSTEENQSPYLLLERAIQII